MYWIHWGVTSTDIMSAHMSHVGGERLAIQVYEPRGMAIDYSDQPQLQENFVHNLKSHCEIYDYTLIKLKRLSID